MGSSSDDLPGSFARSEDLLDILRKGRTFAEELLQENERLRYRILQIEKEQYVPGESEEIERLRAENALLREKLNHIDSRLSEIESDNIDFAERHHEIVMQNESLANLYVASYQLHASLQPDDVAQAIGEILVGLIGARSYAVFMKEDDRLSIVAGEDYSDLFPDGGIADRDRLEWQVVDRGEPYFGNAATENEQTAVVPLQLGNDSIGAIGLYRMLSQKTGGFTPIDHELLNLLAGQAAAALVSSRLFAQKSNMS